MGMFKGAGLRENMREEEIRVFCRKIGLQIETSMWFHFNQQVVEIN